MTHIIPGEFNSMAFVWDAGANGHDHVLVLKISGSDNKMSEICLTKEQASALVNAINKAWEF